MALIECPECRKPVSTTAHACPNCGFPVAEKYGQSQPSQPRQQPQARAAPADLGQLLAEVRPSWWGYFWYLFFFWLIVPPIIAYFRRASTVLRVFPERILLEHKVGALALDEDGGTVFYVRR